MNLSLGKMKKMSRTKIVIGIIILVGIGFIFARNKNATVEQEVAIADRAVKLATVAELSQISTP